MPSPTYTCKVCSQEFWLDPAEMLRFLPDHLDSAVCKRARRQAHVRSTLSRMGRWFRRLLLGRQPERIEYVIRAPMELVTVSAPGPIDLLAPAYEQQRADIGGGHPPPPLRWRRTNIDRLQTIVSEQLALARRQGFIPEQPVEPTELRRWSRCRVVYPDAPGGARRAQGLEELTVVMTRR